jgi:hypothetical protein
MMSTRGMGIKNIPIAYLYLISEYFETLYKKRRTEKILMIEINIKTIKYNTLPTKRSYNSLLKYDTITPTNKNEAIKNAKYNTKSVYK